MSTRKKPNDNSPSLDIGYVVTVKSNLYFKIEYMEKVLLEVPDTGTWVLDNTRPFLHSSIVKLLNNVSMF